MGNAVLNEQLTKKEKQDALFKVLKKISDDLFSGKQQDLANCINVDKSSVSVWFDKKSCTANTEKRDNNFQVIINFIAVYRSLCSIFPSPEDRRTWFFSQNSHLGNSPLKLMQGNIEGLFTVRQYLDYMRGLGV